MKESQSQDKDVSSHLSQIEDIIRPNYCKKPPQRLPEDDDVIPTEHHILQKVSNSNPALAMVLNGPRVVTGEYGCHGKIPQNTNSVITRISITFSVLTTGPNFHNLRIWGKWG